MAAVLATGNQGQVKGMTLPAGLPASVVRAFPASTAQPCAAVLVEGDAARVQAVLADVADWPGPLVSVHAARTDRPLAYQLEWLLEEVSTSINTTAAGGNASLMMMA